MIYMKIHCKICGKEVHPMGWPKHVNREKRIHGKDIYVKIKEDYEGKKYSSTLKVYNNSLLNFMGDKDELSQLN